MRHPQMLQGVGEAVALPYAADVTALLLCQALKALQLTCTEKQGMGAKLANMVFGESERLMCSLEIPVQCVQGGHS